MMRYGVLALSLAVLMMLWPVLGDAKTNNLGSSSDSPVSLGLLPVHVASDHQDDKRLAGMIETFEDALALALTGIDVVDRRHIRDILKELDESQANVGDLKLGKLVGAEVLLVSVLHREDDRAVLDLSALETESGRILHHLSSTISTVTTCEVAVKTFFSDLPAQLERRDYLADVAFLAISHASPFKLDNMAESLRQRLCEKLSALDGIRVLDRELAAFILKEARLAADAYVDPYRKFMPVSSAITIQGKLTQEVKQGTPLDESSLTLELTIRSGSQTNVISRTETLGTVADLELAIVRDLCQLVLAFAGTPQDVQVTLDDQARRYWEGQKYLALALANVDREKSIIKAASLMPESPEPYEVAQKLTLVCSDYAPVLDRSRVIPHQSDAMQAFQRHFIDQFQHHPLWPRAVRSAQMFLLGYRFMSPHLAIAKQGISGEFAGNYKQALELANRFVDVLYTSPEIFAKASSDPACAAPSLYLLLLDGQYQRAFELCVGYKDVNWYTSKELMNLFVLRAIDLGELDWAYQAAQLSYQLYPKYPIRGLASNNRPKKIEKDSEPVRWDSFLTDTKNYDKAQEYHKPDLPKWGTLSLVDRVELLSPPQKQEVYDNVRLIDAEHHAKGGGEPPSPITLYKLNREDILSISGEGGELLALSRQGHRYRIWKVEHDQWVWLDGLPQLKKNQQIKRPLQRPLLAQFNDTFYIAAGEQGFFSTIPPERASPSVQEIPPPRAGEFFPLSPAQDERANQWLFSTNIVHFKAGSNAPPQQDLSFIAPQKKAPRVKRVEGFPEDGIVLSLMVVGDSLFAAGAAQEVGFFARLKRGATEWKFWTSPTWAHAVELVERYDDGQWLLAIGGNWGERAKHLVVVFDPADGTWDRRVYGPYGKRQRFLKMASQGRRALYMNDHGGGQQTLFYADAERQAVHPIHAPPSSMSIFSDILYRHEDLWRWNQQEGSDDLPYATKYERECRWGQHQNCAMAPLAADYAVDLLAHDGLFWILDTHGGLTATADGRSFAGPFMAEGAAKWMCLVDDKLAVVTRSGIYTIPMSFLRSQLSEAGVWHYSGQIVTTARERIERWIQGATPDQQTNYFNHVYRRFLCRSLCEPWRCRIPPHSPALQPRRARSNGTLVPNVRK